MKWLVVVLAIAVVGTGIGFGWVLLSAVDESGRPVDANSPSPSRSAAPARPDSRAVSRPVPILHHVERTESAPVDELRIVGRVVRQGDREPVAGANVRFELADGTTFSGSNKFADEKGRFEFLAPKKPYVQVLVKVMTASGHGKRMIEVEPPFVGTRDLGEVELAPVHTVWFRVLTTHDAPIAGAVAHGIPHKSSVAISDSQGNGFVESNEALTAIRFAAPGFEVTEVPLRAGEDSVTVRLEAGTSLTIRVTTPVGAPAPDATKVMIECPGSPYELGVTDPLWGPLGNTTPERWKNDVLTYQKNTITVCPARSGARIQITVQEHAREEAVREEIVLSKGESRVLDIVLPGDFGRLWGRVIGAYGRPVQGATVLLGKKDVNRTTSPNGEFDFGAVPAQPLDLRVSCPTYAFWRAAEHRVQKDSRPLEIRLEEGVRVEVNLIDSEGAPVKGASVYAVNRDNRTDVNGKAVLMSLPRDVVTIDVFVSGVRSAFQHDASIPVATLRLDHPVKK